MPQRPIWRSSRSSSTRCCSCSAARAGRLRPRARPSRGCSAPPAGVAAGVTGLLVWGQAQTELRGTANPRRGRRTSGSGSPWPRRRRRGVRAPPDPAAGTPRTARPAGGGLVALVAVFVQGYLGGRMTSDHGAASTPGGGSPRPPSSAMRQDLDLSPRRHGHGRGRAAGVLGTGPGLRQLPRRPGPGARGPGLAGGREVEEFRGVHGHGLFPPAMVSDRDVAAIDAFLQTLGPAGR